MQKRIFTPAEIDTIRAKYSNTLTSTIAIKLGVTEGQVYRCAYKLGLKKSADFLRGDLSGRISKATAVGIQYRFKPGHTPYNKGKKINHTEKAKAAMANTQFKPGQAPHNAYPNGTEAIWTDHKTGRQYWKIKIAGFPKMLYKHVYIYLQHYGEVPSGHIIRFKDGNTLNCVIDNLEAITRSENMKRNSIVRYPSELRQIMHLQNKLIKAIHQHEKQD